MKQNCEKRLISTRIDKDLAKEFKKYCAINEMSQQDCIRKFICDCVILYKNGEILIAKKNK